MDAMLGLFGPLARLLGRDWALSALILSCCLALSGFCVLARAMALRNARARLLAQVRSGDLAGQHRVRDFIEQRQSDWLWTLLICFFCCAFEALVLVTSLSLWPFPSQRLIWAASVMLSLCMGAPLIAWALRQFLGAWNVGDWSLRALFGHQSMLDRYLLSDEVP